MWLDNIFVFYTYPDFERLKKFVPAKTSLGVYKYSMVPAQVQFASVGGVKRALASR